MFHLLKIEIEGFRSFKDKAIIEFPESGAVLISGKYKNEEISSGSGKSSILMAIAYALGFGSLPATELKNWDSKAISVRLEIKNNNEIIEITRNPKLQVVISGETYAGTSAQEKLDKILNVSSEFLKILTYRPQREPGSFLRAPDSEKKNLLREMLQLSDIDRAFDKIKSEHDNKASSIDSLNREVSFLAQSLSGWAVDQGEFEKTEKEFTDYKIEFESIKGNKELIENTNKLNNIKAEISRIGSITNQIYVKKQQNSELQTRINNIETEIKHMQDEKCPTCLQFWKKSVNALEQRVAFISHTKKQIEGNIMAIAAAETLTAFLPKIQTDYDDIIKKTGDESNRAKEIIEKLNMSKRLLTSLNDKKNRFHSISNDISNKELQKIQYEKDLTKYVHILKILSNQGFLGYIFDELLQELEIIVNSLICDIPNLSTFSVSIESVQVNKSGNVKNNITVKLQKLGRDIQIKNLSGGQTCALELCFDLAISEIIRKRSGMKFNWIALDESMDGLDIETKRCAIETIKKNINGLIIIVDHSTEIKESFEKIVNVEFDGKTSYLI